jgi:type III secretion protein N (ATPase)
VPLDLANLDAKLSSTEVVRVQGRVQAVVGLGVYGVIPGARVGELVEIHRRSGEPLLAEVVGFDEERVVLAPLGACGGVGPGDAISATGRYFTVSFSEALLGRVLDGLGRSMDSGPPIQGEQREVAGPAPEPMSRPLVREALPVGIRAIDAFLTVGRGQRVGIFSGSGAGKSTLIGQIARQADADAFVVCLVGERGRELGEFLEDSLGDEGRKRGVVVCSTSDMPALVRMKCAHVATCIAEGFRDLGLRVVLLVDSVTRFARAAREVGLGAGEAPTRRGFPPSVFSALPALLERSGSSPRGSITAFYTVLVEGGDLDEPVADEVRGIVDGHIVLRREIGERGRWPAIDVLGSLSRVMDRVVGREHLEAAQNARAHMAVVEAKRDLVALGAYKPGTDPRLDRALERLRGIEEFLSQKPQERSDFRETVRRLASFA